MFNKNPHIFREEYPEPQKQNQGQSRIDEDKSQNRDIDKDKDIYNSNYSAKKTNIFNRDFFKFFRLPIIIIIFLIAAVLSLKFIFSHIGTGKQKNYGSKNYKDKTVNEKKKFSPAVFDYAEKSKNPVADKKTDDKFNSKLSKEIKGLNKIKLSKGLKSNDYSYPSPKPAINGNISKDMVVFIKASYDGKILSMEKRQSGGGKNALEINGKPLKARRLDSNCNSSGKANLIIPQGTVVDAYTKYKIFSYNTEVPIIAILSNSYYYNGKIILNRGCKFFGMVSVKHSLNRLNINLNKVIKINGHSISIDAIAMMPNGSGGVKGIVHNHYTGSILASIAQSVVGAASIFAGGGSGMDSSNPYTFQNQLRENIAQNELNKAQSGINGYSESKSNASITLPKDTHIKIIFLKAVYRN